VDVEKAKEVKDEMAYRLKEQVKEPPKPNPTAPFDQFGSVQVRHPYRTARLARVERCASCTRIEGACRILSWVLVLGDTRTGYEAVDGVLSKVLLKTCQQRPHRHLIRSGPEPSFSPCTAVAPLEISPTGWQGSWTDILALCGVRGCQDVMRNQNISSIDQLTQEMMRNNSRGFGTIYAINLPQWLPREVSTHDG
jgi:hypothetical protein